MEDLAQPELSDNLIEQFGRQILVPGIDEQGQLNLSKRKVCIIGLGALGTAPFPVTILVTKQDKFKKDFK